MEKGLYFTPISTFLGSVGQGTRSVTQFPFLSNCDDNIYFTVLFGRQNSGNHKMLYKCKVFQGPVHS